MKSSEKYQHLLSTDSLSGGLREQSVRGGVFSFGSEAADFVLRIGSLAIIARILTPEDFGLLGMVSSVTYVAERFKDLGLSTATVQRKDITHAQVSNLFWLNATFGLAISLVILALAPGITAFFKEDRLMGITAAVSLSFAIGGLSVQHQAILRRQMKFGQLAFIRIGSSLISVGLCVFLAWRGYGYWSLVWRDVLRSALYTAGCWAFSRWIPSLMSRGTETRSMVRFGGYIMASNTLFYFSSGLDQILIGKLFGAVPVGLYRQGYQLAINTVGQLTGPVASVAEPALCALQTQAEKYRRFYRKLVETVAMVSMPLAAFLVVYAESIVDVLLGDKWHEATPVFRVLSLAAFIRPVVATSGSVLISFGRSKRAFILDTVRCVVLLTMFACLSYWGIVGVAFAHVATSCLMLLPNLHYSFAGTPLSLGDFFRPIAHSAIASGIMAGVLSVATQLFPQHNPWVSLGIGGGLAALTYFGTWALLPGGRSKLNEAVEDLITPLIPTRLRPARKSA